jgi:hypothetical protein
LLPAVRFSLNQGGRLVEDNFTLACGSGALLLAMVWSLAAAALLDQISFGLGCFASLLLLSAMLWSHLVTDPITQLTKAWQVLSSSSDGNANGNSSSFEQSLMNSIALEKEVSDGTGKGEGSVHSAGRSDYSKTLATTAVSPSLLSILRAARTSAIMASTEDDEEDLFREEVEDGGEEGLPHNGGESGGVDGVTGGTLAHSAYARVPNKHDIKAEARWAKEHAITEADLLLSVGVVKALVKRRVVFTARQVHLSLCGGGGGGITGQGVPGGEQATTATATAAAAVAASEVVEGLGKAGDGCGLFVPIPGGGSGGGGVVGASGLVVGSAAAADVERDIEGGGSGGGEQKSTNSMMVTVGSLAVEQTRVKEEVAASVRELIAERLDQSPRSFFSRGVVRSPEAVANLRRAAERVLSGEGLCWCVPVTTDTSLSGEDSRTASQSSSSLSSPPGILDGPNKSGVLTRLDLSALSSVAVGGGAGDLSPTLTSSSSTATHSDTDHFFAWFVLTALQKAQAQKFKTTALTMAHFQFEVSINRVF